MKIRTYLWIQNVLDEQNVNAVYNSTGLPNNDGYLTTPGGQAWLQSSTTMGDSEFASNLYQSRVGTSGNYSSPRQVRIGFRVDF